MASPAAIEAVRALFETFATRDAGRFVSHLTEDVIFAPSAFITGRAEYRGREDVILGFTEIEHLFADKGETVEVRAQRFFVDEENENLALVLAEITITRRHGESFGTPAAYLFTFEGDKVAELRTWLDHGQGLEQLGRPDEIAAPT